MGTLLIHCSRFVRQVVLLLLTLTLSIALRQPAQAQDEPPYLYYYSDVLNAFVVERADGSDSRVLGAGLMPDSTNQVDGAGWSPSGEWFMWNAVRSREGRGRHTPFIMSADGSQVLHALDPYAGGVDVFSAWAPVEDIIVYIYKIWEDSQRGWRWIFVDASTDVVLTTFFYDSFDSVVNIGWSESGEYVSVYYYEIPSPNMVYVDSFDITGVQRFSGEVERTQLGNIGVTWTSSTLSVDELIEQMGQNSLIPSPNGRYTLPTAYGGLLENPQVYDYQTETTIFYPIHSGAVFNATKFIWSSSSEWLLITQDRSFAGGGRLNDVSSVVRSDGTFYRELGRCLVNNICVNWLPDAVILHLAPGASTSVVQQPAKQFIFENTPIAQIEWNTPYSLTLTNDVGWIYPWMYSLLIFVSSPIPDVKQWVGLGSNASLTRGACAWNSPFIAGWRSSIW